MLVTTDTKTITAQLAAGMTTAQPTIVIAYASVAFSIVEGGEEFTCNGVTPVVILGAPGSGTRAVVKSIFFVNNDTVSHTVTVKQNGVICIKRLVLAGGSLDLLAPIMSQLGGTGTAGRLTKWVDPVTLGDTQLISSVTGSTLTIGGAPTVPRTLTAPDVTGNFAIDSFANVFTATQTIDLSTGALPTAINAGATSLRIADGRIQEYITFANSGIVRIARCADGTRAVPTPVPNARAFMGDQVNGWDGATWATAATSYAVFSDGLWSAANHGFFHSWAGVPNGSTTATEILRLQNSAAALGNISAVAGNGLIQLASGTTKANGISQNADTFQWRQSAGMWGVGDSATGGAASSARHGYYFGQGGYAAPGAYQADNNGDKLVLYRGDGYDARVGVGSASNLWYLSGSAGGAGGAHEFYTAASSGSATLQVSIGHNTLGFFGVAPVAKATGFGTPTNIARLINFPGTAATLAQCGGAISDLITYLKSRGDLGA
jgi:hypothetical protein